MTDYKLKFVDEAAAMAVLKDGDQFIHPNTVIIGTIYRNTGTPEEPVMTTLPGFHADVRALVEAPELEAYRVFPASPVHRWA